MTLQSATRDRQDAREQALALTFGNLAAGTVNRVKPHRPRELPTARASRIVHPHPASRWHVNDPQSVC